MSRLECEVVSVLVPKNLLRFSGVRTLEWSLVGFIRVETMLLFTEKLILTVLIFVLFITNVRYIITFLK